MKNSIGSLAALAACVLPLAADAAVQAASFADEIAPFENSGSLALDIDGDSTDDFQIYSNGIVVSLTSFETTLFTPGTVAFGDTLDVADAINGSAYIDDTDIEAFTTGYYGFSFATGAGTHAGWIFLDFSGATKYAVSAAWETTPGASITVGAAIPEPSAAAALAGAGVLLGASALRRRRPSA
jgi:hypothetical protein